MNSLKKLSEYEKHKENPYLGMGKIELIRKTDYFGTDSVVFQHSTGAIQGMNIVARRRKVDGARFVKLYTDKIASWLELTKNAQKVLVYLIGEMRPGSDMIIFSLEKCMVVSEYKSEAPVYNALAELIEHSIIARSGQPTMYFLNPYFMFSGNRVLFMDSLERVDEKTNHKLSSAGHHSPVMALPVSNEDTAFDFG